MALDFSKIRIPSGESVTNDDSVESVEEVSDGFRNDSESSGIDDSPVGVSPDLDEWESGVDEVVTGGDSSTSTVESGGGDPGLVFDDDSDGEWNPFLSDDEGVESGVARVVGKSGVPERVRVPDDVVSNSKARAEFKKRGRGVSKSSGDSGEGDSSKSGDVRLSGKSVAVLGERSRGGSSGSSSVDGSGVRPGEVWDGSVGKRGSGSRWKRDGGRLNAAELEFFRGNESSFAEALRGEGPVASLRAPAHVGESDVSREERLRRVSEAVFGRDAFRRSSKLVFGFKHFEMLEFLALFKFANVRQLAQLFSESPRTTVVRLRKLRECGLVEDRKLFGGESVWYLTETGQLLSGYDFPRLVESRLNLAMVPHSFVVNHVAANLWRSNVNVLNDSLYPRSNRVDVFGKRVFGELLVSEFEVQSAFSKLRLSSRADVYRRSIVDMIDRAFREWEAAGGVSSGIESPEQVFGNEFMWVLFPPAALKLAHHVPDLVVKRPRNEDGSPESLAVEIELANKSVESYRRSLNAYRYDERMFKQVVWVCKSKGAARKLRDIAQENGMWDDGRVKILPIITSDGVFKGKDLWAL